MPSPPARQGQRQHRHPLPARRQRTPPQRRRHRHRHPLLRPRRRNRRRPHSGQPDALPGLRPPGHRHARGLPRRRPGRHPPQTTPLRRPRPTTPTGTAPDFPGTAPDFPGTKGFVGGTLDATGLTHIGAREYDPTLGAFISPDPLLDPANPLQANAYTYANNTPVTASDPTGEMLYDEVTKKGFGNNKVRKSWYRIQGYTNSRGNVTNKYRTLVRHNTRSFNSYWRQVRAAEAVRQAEIAAQRKIQEAMRRLERNIQNILGGASLQEQLDQVMSSPEASEALDRQFAKMSESDPCDSSYARASGACGVRGGDGPGTNFVRNGTSRGDVLSGSVCGIYLCR
ncbi:RHS repeat-associated core domain-containing protein [Streptomyces sp. CNQ-509]|uniref:RHS repeat-associated core domain-containing protein n=1 Tax=Streptomyces sp. CNQ-509 TaxID=444103 RepID=UPI000A9A2BB7|nr:RHS repeat-associated core domain-containing protein [Streptomyces sp. CNQ-509]